MWQAIGYRRLQAITIALLAALVTACVVFAPIYQRAELESLIRVKLAAAGDPLRDLQLMSRPLGDPDSPGGSAARPIATLGTLLPAEVRRRLARPISGQTAEAAFIGQSRTANGATGSLVSRESLCEHVTMVSGRCPQRAGQIAINAADSRNFGLRVHTTVELEARLGAVEPGPGQPPPPPLELRVVGVYRADDGPYWFGARLTGLSGTMAPNSPVLHDPWLTSSSTFAALEKADRRTAPLPTSTLDYSVEVSHTSVDQLLGLGRAIARLRDRYGQDPAYSDLAVSSGIPEIASAVRHQRGQARVTVPLLTVQLALLAVIALALVLGAATEQRRPEVAVAMLRGRGRRGARALLLRELVPAVLVGAVIGFAAAVLLGVVARAALPGRVPFGLGLDPVLALGAAVVVVLATTLLAVRRVSREPVEQLLRSVPVRRSGWALGAAEAVLLAVAGTVVVAFFTGGLTGPIALAAPLLLAVVVGLLLAHATTPLAAVVGQRLLARGRVRSGVGVLDAARNPATRRTVAIVTVATALLGFTATAVAVGSRNRAAAAAQETGAPMRVRVEDRDLRGVLRALDDVDPYGRSVTPVVTVQPPGEGASATMAVRPSGFARIALFGKDVAPLDAKLLAPPRAAPVRLEGDRLRVTLRSQQIVVTHAHGRRATASLALDLADTDGDTSSIPLGTLGAATSTRSAEIPCDNGCDVTGVSILTTAGALVTGTVELRDLITPSASSGSSGSAPVALGPATDWHTVRGRDGPQMAASGRDTDSLSVAIDTRGSRRTTMTQAWIPDRIPTVFTGDPTATIAGLDGVERRARTAGRLTRVPGVGASAALVNLDVLDRASEPGSDVSIDLWFAHQSASALRQVKAALATRGIRIDPPTTLTAVRRSYDESSAAWSLALGVVVGVAGLLIGLLVVVILAANTWRSRARDLAVLRMGGMRGSSVRGIATVSQLPAIVVATLAGTACGAVGAHFALPTVPLFASSPLVSTLDLSLPWPVLLACGASALVVLLGAGWLVAVSVAHRAVPTRLREAV